MRIKRRNFIRIVSYCVAVMLILGGYLISEHNNKNYLVSQIRNGYNENLTEFISYLSEINTDLQKTLYSGTPETLATLSADIYKNSGAAKDCLSRLPVSVESSSSIYKFLSQAGDFSLSVAKAAAENDTVTAKSQKQLQSLLSYSTNVTQRFTSLSDEVTEGESFDKDIANVINQIEEDTDFSTGVEDIEQTATDYPTLIYDGPFSDHISAAEPKLLKNENSITKDKALQIAKKWLKDDDISYKSMEKSATESYVFEGSKSVCAITKKGGYCLYLNKSKNINESNIYEDYAVNTAVGYIKEMTGKTFEPSYYIIDENIMTVNLAYKQDGVICYSDLIKVGISMDDAKVVSVEARGYIMNHHSRNIEATKHSVDEAKKIVNDNLTVKSCNRAIIVDSGLNEKDVYEFHCKATDNQDVLVYINTKTLAEEQIFIIQHTEGGTLTK